MAQTPCYLVSDGESMDYDFSSDATAGDVVEIGSIPMIVKRDVDVSENARGTVEFGDVWDVPQKAEIIQAGDAVYWDDAGDPYGGTAGSGAATGTATSNNLMGVAAPIQRNGTSDTTATDTHVRVILTAAERTATIAGSVTTDDISGSDSTLTIGGLAAAQGGLISVTGGTSSTSANAGGAVSMLGGTGGATGAGGAASLTGGTSGATSGTGGVTTVAGGAAGSAAGNAAGGAVVVVGGLGKGTGAGGAVGGTGGGSGSGATGNGGAYAVAGGAANSTNGAGGAVSATGGAGVGSGNGGAASLVGGVSGATGAGGAIAITSGASAGAGGTAGAIAMDTGAATGGTGAGILIGDVNATGVTITAPLNYAAGGGAADVQTLTLAPAATRYTTGMMIAWRPTADNTGACTMNVNGLGAKSIKTNTGADPAAGDLQATTGIHIAMYDGTNFVLINPSTTTD